MATRIMTPPSYTNQVPQNAYQSYSSGFSFRKRMERVDWRKISMVDIDHISRTLDFTTLQENIMNITFCNLEAELDIRTVDPNFIKLFKLAQLTIEYLLHSQEYLASLCTSLEEKSKNQDQEMEKLKQEKDTLQKELSEVKKESHKRKKMLMAQQQLLLVGNDNYNKCPFCTKAFVSNAYLQAHVVRRHSSGTKDGFNSVSPDLGVGSESGRHQLEAEICQIKERLSKYEAEHQEEKPITKTDNKVVTSAVIQVNQNSSQPMDVVEEGEQIGVSAALMKEVKELNAKYQASQKALQELEARTGKKRSYLGDLEDEIENEKELLREQRSEVAVYKEQLQQQLNQMKNHMESKLSKQDKKWQQKMQKITQEHASELKKLNNALETTSRSQEDMANTKLGKRQQQEVEEILRQSREREKTLEKQEWQLKKDRVQSLEGKPKKSSSSVVEASKVKSQVADASKVKTQVSAIDPASRNKPGPQMYPSDDEGSAGFGTGTSSLKTYQSGAGKSTLGQTGTQSLHTLQFLEELRKNPTLAVMRDQLAELLQEQIEKKGIAAPNNPELANRNQHHRPHHCCCCRKRLISAHCLGLRKYPDFNEWRNFYDKKATEEAKKQIKLQSASPWNRTPQGSTQARTRRRLDLSLHKSPLPPSEVRSGPPHPQQHLSAQRNFSRSSGPRSSTGSAALGQTSGFNPQPHPRSTTPQNKKVPPSNGGDLANNTQYDSDDSWGDDSAGDRTAGPPGTRLIQSGPARDLSAPTPSPRSHRPQTRLIQSQGPQARLIQSKPIKSQQGSGYDQYDGKPAGFPTPAPQKGENFNFNDMKSRVGAKLQARSTAGRPFGGVNVGGMVKHQEKTANEVNSDGEDDWDDESDLDGPAAPTSKPQVGRGSTDASNTYGSSAWGSTSKAASTIKDRERRSTSRSSFVSVTSVSSDGDGI